MESSDNSSDESTSTNSGSSTIHDNNSTTYPAQYSKTLADLNDILRKDHWSDNEIKAYSNVSVLAQKYCNKYTVVKNSMICRDFLGKCVKSKQWYIKSKYKSIIDGILGDINIVCNNKRYDTSNTHVKFHKVKLEFPTYNLGFGFQIKYIGNHFTKMVQKDVNNGKSGYKAGVNFERCNNCHSERGFVLLHIPKSSSNITSTVPDFDKILYLLPRGLDGIMRIEVLYLVKLLLLYFDRSKITMKLPMSNTCNITINELIKKAKEKMDIDSSKPKIDYITMHQNLVGLS